MAVPKKKAVQTRVKKPISKDKKPTVLKWQKHHLGGEYSPYKLGSIYRFKGKYMYRTSYNRYYNASSLAEAKKKVDEYSKQKQQEFLKDNKQVTSKSKTQQKRVNKK